VEGHTHEAAGLLLDGNVARVDPLRGLVAHDRRMAHHLEIRWKQTREKKKKQTDRMWIGLVGGAVVVGVSVVAGRASK
jgi:hypothetical protein